MCNFLCTVSNNTIVPINYKNESICHNKIKIIKRFSWLLRLLSAFYSVVFMVYISSFPDPWRFGPPRSKSYSFLQGLERFFPSTGSGYGYGNLHTKAQMTTKITNIKVCLIFHRAECSLFWRDGGFSCGFEILQRGRRRNITLIKRKINVFSP